MRRYLFYPAISCYCQILMGMNTPSREAILSKSFASIVKWQESKQEITKIVSIRQSGRSSISSVFIPLKTIKGYIFYKSVSESKALRSIRFRMTSDVATFTNPVHYTNFSRMVVKNR